MYFLLNIAQIWGIGNYGLEKLFNLYPNINNYNILSVEGYNQNKYIILKLDNLEELDKFLNEIYETVIIDKKYEPKTFTLQNGDKIEVCNKLTIYDDYVE